MLALLADGPLAGSEIELDEPRPMLELTAEGVPAAPGEPAAHRYRLADVELEWLASSVESFRKLAVYVCARDQHASKTMRRAA